MLATSECSLRKLAVRWTESKRKGRSPGTSRPSCFDARKQFGVGVAEDVDGLHGVADDEAGAALALGPGGDEAPKQFVLTAARVLEFVDQQVANAVGDGLRGVDWKFVFAFEHAERDLRDLSEVSSGRLGEDDAEFGGSAAQQSETGADNLPFRAGVSDGS